ncbi:hypothetical protein [Streptacidiphilus sp. EB129]|uniref:hypothetical protein n=1 Tax=Streptacidiphilus sp. EB129 TaxID=3156262 RepID=UPI0035167D3F
MTSLTLSPARSGGSYVLVEESGRMCGLLSVDKRMRKGEMSGDWGSVPLRSVGMRRASAYAGDEQAPLVRLAPPVATLSDGPPARWEIRRDRHEYTGTLSADGAEIRITVPAHGAVSATAQVTGQWPQRDRLLLTAIFAMLARRRGDVMATAVGVAIATGGSR